MPDFSLERVEEWLEALEERSVHSPLVYYAPTEAHRSLFHALCQTYLEASDRERGVIRSAVGDKKGVLNQLLGVVYSSAQQLRATQDVTWLRIGAAAASMQSGHLDYRDFLLALADLYVSAEETGLDPESEFEVMGIGLPENFHAYAVVRGRRSRDRVSMEGKMREAGMRAKAIVKSQYRASLAMLRQAIERCPDSLWADGDYSNPFWHVAYHVIFYTHLYLHPTEDDFVPWEKHRDGIVSLGDSVEGEVPYSREDVLEYLDLCLEQMEQQVDAMDLEAESGFYWLPFDKLELQFYNIRHVQQHTGELCERLGAHGEIEVDWVGMKA